MPTHINRTLKLDDSAMDGFGEFRARLAGTLGRIPQNSEAFRILLRIGNGYFDQAESIIRQESE